MDTSWWLALGAVIVLALVAAVVDGRARLGPRRPVPPRRQGPPPPGPLPEPRPGEVWWAQVPYEDGTGARERPCLVLTVTGDTVRVVKITSSRPAADRATVVPLPHGAIDDTHGRPNFLMTDELRDVPRWDFRSRAGSVDTELWERVRHLAE